MTKRGGILVAAVLGLSTALTAAVATDTLDLGGPTKTEIRETEDGLPETYSEPNFPDPATVPSPVVEGPFRIVSFGWPGGVENAYAGNPGGPKSQTTDEESVKNDDLYVEISVPPELSVSRRLSATRLGDSTVELRISLAIKSDQGQTGIEIVRWRPVLPFNVERPGDNGERLFEIGTVAGVPAVFYTSPPKGPTDNSIWFIQEDGLLTQLSGGVPFDDLMKIAEKILSSED